MHFCGFRNTIPNPYRLRRYKKFSVKTNIPQQMFPSSAVFLPNPHGSTAFRFAKRPTSKTSNQKHRAKSPTPKQVIGNTVQSAQLQKQVIENSLQSARFQNK